MYLFSHVFYPNFQPPIQHLKKSAIFQSSRHFTSPGLGWVGWKWFFSSVFIPESSLRIYKTSHSYLFSHGFYQNFQPPIQNIHFWRFPPFSISGNGFGWVQIYFLEDLIIQKIDMGVCNLSLVPPGTWFSLISDVESEAESEAESGANMIYIVFMSNCL